MTATDAASDDIRALADAIEMIAVQTKLLALNAAVEAAGRGPAAADVLTAAEEVHRLAVLSAAAARQKADGSAAAGASGYGCPSAGGADRCDRPAKTADIAAGSQRIAADG